MAIRAFLAVELDEHARRSAAELAQRIGREAEGVRWVRPESYHVTLRFLGNVEPAALPPLTSAVAERVARCAPFVLRLGRLALFPGARRPRVVALRLETEPEAALACLAGAVEQGVVAAGFAPEARGFRAHLTLGRIRGRGWHARLPEDPLGAAFDVREVVLFESRLHADGARYVPLERLTLRGDVSPDTPKTEGEEHGKE